MQLSIGPFVASPVDKQASVFDGSLLDLLIHAAHRVVQINVSRPSTEFGWNIARVDAKHSNVLVGRPELNSDRDAEGVERRLGYAVADVCSTIVGFVLISSSIES